ncbi:prolipoprotein diacylglyceryl transferase [Spiroplasma endosymbiont of Amphibalanus improvisus]|uniref:prolipoprotein diacylglyceryl transferase n=1 Tax=Spiroplasma endosymbiont of Amphibalanus improvisus TaxID=3066327 RepID=UPI00313E609C
MIMLLAFIVVIGVAWLRFHKRKIPTRPLYLAVFILVPVGLLGASIFGKFDPEHPIPWYELLEFWLPGMSIHGGILFGGLAGWGWFYYQSKKYRVSTWVYFDLMFPTVFLGQGIGRWGNFFNHEVFGKPVSYDSLSWLPPAIRNNCFKWYVPDVLYPGFYPTQALGIDGSPIDDLSNFSQIQYYNPIFLWESITDIALFFIIIFLIPFLVKLIKSKPWKRITNLHDFKVVWIQYYYEVEVDKNKLNNYVDNLEKPNQSYLEYEKQVKKIKKSRRIKYWTQYKWTTTKKWFQKDCRELEQIQNPHNLFVFRAGVQGGFWIFSYNFIRFFFELQRLPDDYFITNMKGLDYFILWFFIVLGLALMFIAQFIAPMKWREPEWYYEKQY